jgi:sulfur carrier protein
MRRGILANLQFPLMIELTVNGEVRTVAAQATVAMLLDEMQLTGKRIAVERNGEIVPKSRHGATPLAAGDQLEIVVAVGGG